MEKENLDNGIKPDVKQSLPFSFTKDKLEKLFEYAFDEGAKWEAIGWAEENADEKRPTLDKWLKENGNVV